MVEIFKTDVQEIIHANELLLLLQHHFPASRINFDLTDCDRILRVEGDCDIIRIMQLVQQKGYSCSVLE